MITDTRDSVVREILQTALNTPLHGIENPTRDAIDGWDSLTHVEIVFMLEEQFNVRFSETEIAELKSLRDIVALLQENHAA